MKMRVLGSLGMVACWSSSSSRPVSNTSSGDRDIAMTEAEPVVGSSSKTEQQLAREQAIEQARAAGILGKQTAPPARAPSATAPSWAVVPPTVPAGPLDKASIRREISAHIKPIRLCYEQGLLQDPTLQGTTKVTFLIGPDGSVTSSTGSGFDPQIDPCVADVVKGIVFPAPDGGVPTKVNYPFVFRPAP
jgi:hypothetical protein